jgi:hypothetical protein
MKPIIRTLIISCIICYISAGCEKEEYDPYSLIGKWDWLATMGDPGPIYRSENNRRIDEYTKDSIYRAFFNGELSIECKFKTYDNNKVAYEKYDYINLNDYQIKNDSLIIRNPNYATTIYYKRIN